ncbi:MAG: putative glycosylase/AP lyase [Planctomycetota bacterium]
MAGRLGDLYPASRCSLDFRSPLELLLATILSAQCTDRRVNLVTPELFRRWPNAATLSAARQEEVEGVIHSTGFFRAKAKNLLGCCRALVERHGGEVPVTLAELVTLPGVGRKTANVVLGVGFDRAEGIVVDTHVGRICRRLDLTRRTDAVGAERDLVKVVPPDRWIVFSHQLIDHGRAVCLARRPRCTSCGLADLCPQRGLPAPAGSAVAPRGRAAGHGKDRSGGVQSRRVGKQPGRKPRRNVP